MGATEPGVDGVDEKLLFDGDRIDICVEGSLSLSCFHNIIFILRWCS